MKTYTKFLIEVFIIIFGALSMQAQNVYINIPAENIFDRTQFITLKNILNTKNHSNWRLGFLAPIWPEISSTSGNNFSHKTLNGITLPTTVLEWQLMSIGGKNAPFRNGDNWPLPYKSFSTNSQYWYQPGSTTGDYTPGNVAFNFRIPANNYGGNIFRAGEYSMDITHNYRSSVLYVIEFTPNNLQVILEIPSAISWRTSNPNKSITISSLNDYGSTSERILGDLGNAELGNTVDFNLNAKASSTNIAFTSSKNVQGTRNISAIQLGSTGTGTVLIKKALSNNWQNYSTPSFIVKTGNRNSFTLQLSVSAADFKTHFFEAGTYTFQLNLDAKSSSGTLIPAISSLQNTDVTIKVLPLSEITIPTSGQTVNFNFNTSAHYRDGQSKVIPKQIKLSNNETFELYVKSATPKFNKGGVQTDINSDILQIGVDGTTLNVPLSTTPQKIITGANPVLDQELNIKYTIPPAGAQILVGKEKTTYSINVIYSFTAL